MFGCAFTLRNTYTTRLLYTVVPSENYAPKNKTVNQLLEALVADINHLQDRGIEAGRAQWLKIDARCLTKGRATGYTSSIWGTKEIGRG